jgi:hypothetical protein
MGYESARRRAVYFTCPIGCSRHAYSLARDECLWTEIPLQIHVRSLQNGYAAEPQARPQCRDVIQLDVKSAFWRDDRRLGRGMVAGTLCDQSSPSQRFVAKTESSHIRWHRMQANPRPALPGGSCWKYHPSASTLLGVALRRVTIILTEISGELGAPRSYLSR